MQIKVNYQSFAIQMQHCKKRPFNFDILINQRAMCLLNLDNFLSTGNRATGNLSKIHDGTANIEHSYFRDQ